MDAIKKPKHRVYVNKIHTGLQHPGMYNVYQYLNGGKGIVKWTSAL